MFGKPRTSEIERLFNEYGPKGDWTTPRVKLEAMDSKRMKLQDREAWFHARGGWSSSRRGTDRGLVGNEGRYCEAIVLDDALTPQRYFNMGMMPFKFPW